MLQFLLNPLLLVPQHRYLVVLERRNIIAYEFMDVNCVQQLLRLLYIPFILLDLFLLLLNVLLHCLFILGKHRQHAELRQDVSERSEHFELLGRQHCVVLIAQVVEVLFAVLDLKGFDVHSVQSHHEAFVLFDVKLNGHLVSALNSSHKANEGFDDVDAGLIVLFLKEVEYFLQDYLCYFLLVQIKSCKYLLDWFFLLIKIDILLFDLFLKSFLSQL